jgi:hypothetical protein
MLRRSHVLTSIAFAVSMLAATDATATPPQRTFVASSGNNVWPCSRMQPCRDFQTAITAVATGGEVIVLDSAGYGPFSVAKSITISAPAGVYAGVTQTLATPAITVAAAAASVVRLRGLTVTGVGPGTGDGILFSSGGMLELEKLDVSGFATTGKQGLLVQTTGQLHIHDSAFHDNYHGILIQVAPGTLRASLDHVQLVNNTSVGLYALDGAVVTITNSVASSNNYGIDAQGTIFAVGVRAPSISVESCQISNNGQDGVVIGGLAGGLLPSIVVSASTITDNGGWGLKGLTGPLGNLIFSRGNNTIVGNAAGAVLLVDPLTPL